MKNFKQKYEFLLRDIEIEEVEKMLQCKDKSKGFWTCYCKNCDTYHKIYLGCNSRLCTNCGKRYSDKWIDKILKNTYKVPHKHVIFTIPPLLWKQLKQDRKSCKVLMDASKKVMDYFFTLTTKNTNPGLILILHTFGRDLNFKPHVHGIITKGGFTKGKFKEWNNQLNQSKLRKVWMWTICTELKKYFPKTEHYQNIFSLIWDKYRKKGFTLIICSETLYNKRQLASYVVRYVRHPAIANTRIHFFDNKVIAFHYICQKTNKRIDKVMKIEEFMFALLQHIPERQFKMIRYYGVYARRSKKLKISYKSIKEYSTNNLIFKCPNCGKKLKKLIFIKKEPPPIKQLIFVK